MTSGNGAGGVGPSVLALGFVLTLGAALAACQSERRNEAEAAAAQRLQRVSVAPFHFRLSGQRQLSAALAESLAARLTRLPGLTAKVEDGRSGSHSDFTVRGDLSSHDGRLVLAVRLYGAERSEPLWNVTFWRKDSLDTALVSDLAQGLAEAVFGQLAREPTSATRGKR